MSGETESNVSAWTIDSLNSHLTEILAERDKRHSGELQSAFEALTTRLNAIDKATDKFEANLNRVPTDVDKQVGHLKELFVETFKTVDERFTGVALQFKERDTRSERESRDNKVAVDAAFAAQKEAASEQNKSNTLAIDKSEKATAETLNKQADLFKSTTDALGERVESNKEVSNKIDTRLTTIESRGVGRTEASVEAKTDQHSWNTLAVAIFAAVVACAAFLTELLRAHP